MTSFFDFGKSFGQAYDAERQRAFQQEEASKTRDLQISENSKSREQTRQLQREEIASALKNLKLQLTQSTQQHTETLTQTATLTREGWVHDTNLQTEKIKAEIDMHNKTLAYNNAALRATQQYQYSTTYDQARETQLAFKKLGIDGDVKIDQYGYARFYPGEISVTPEVALAKAEKPYPSKIPTANPFEQLLRIAQDGIAGVGPNMAKELIAKQGISQGIQASDLKNTEGYAQKVSDVLNKNPQALSDPRVVMAMDAIDKIIGRSDFSKEEVQSNPKLPASREIQSYINMLMSSRPKQ